MQYIKKPQKVEAVQWHGDNLPELVDLVGEDAIEVGTAIFINGVSGVGRLSLGSFVVKDEEGKVEIMSQYDFKNQFIPAPSVYPGGYPEQNHML